MKQTKLKPTAIKLSEIKPSTNFKSPKAIGQMMVWSCVGMAYFNFFSSLNLSAGLQFGLSGVLPMAALIGYLLMPKPKSPLDHSNPKVDESSH
ncbi:hypothetical protein IQ266_06990 [filamentous cyanobacterium LEGE 11480]|uniref:Uncharacterized protein n=1 Tax=Romeriopsis navalis LEGE 11480 TaxID=2777977 RepID=A0A928Z2X8_9CYAN|nr:hypothetical protein [Romeriopsis navalis]MBE9029507.1 hypothetical protein [Romeriopsis navalis LEGE 11480]